MPTSRKSRSVIAVALMAVGTATSYAAPAGPADRVSIIVEAESSQLVKTDLTADRAVEPQRPGVSSPLRQSLRLDVSRARVGSVSDASSSPAASVPQKSLTSADQSRISVKAMLSAGNPESVSPGVPGSTAQPVAFIALNAQADRSSNAGLTDAASNQPPSTNEAATPVPAAREAVSVDAAGAAPVELGALSVAEAVNNTMLAPVAPTESQPEKGVAASAAEDSSLASADSSSVKLAVAEVAIQPVVVAIAPSIEAARPIAPSSWLLSRDDRTVRTALERWSRQNDWNLSWEFPTDFQIEFNAQFEGEFIDAVAKVLDGLSTAEKPITAEFYNGNRVLRILSGRQ